MNANELIDKLSANPTSPLDLAATSAAALPTILRALRLLAAAEANDGSTPETDACADWNARCERVGDNEIITHGLMLALAHDEGDELRLLASRLERERNALAARVAELEPALLKANDQCRSFFQIANRIATEMGTHAMQTNFGAFTESTKALLDEQHEILTRLNIYAARSK